MSNIVIFLVNSYKLNILLLMPTCTDFILTYNSNKKNIKYYKKIVVTYFRGPKNVRRP